MTAVPRLYPVTLDLSCPVHGVVERITVTSLAAQVFWTKAISEAHEAHGCSLLLETLVPTDA